MRHKGDLTGAIAEYREAVQRDPQLSRGLRRLGVALGENGDVERGSVDAADGHKS